MLIRRREAVSGGDGVSVSSGLTVIFEVAGVTEVKKKGLR